MAFASHLLDLDVAYHELPRVMLRYAEELPRLPAVYFIWNSHGKIMYIGRAKDVRQRFTGSGSTSASSNGWSHKLFMKAMKYDDCLLWRVTWHHMPEEDLHSVERQYIDIYQPPLNTQHIREKKKCALPPSSGYALALACGVTIDD